MTIRNLEHTFNPKSVAIIGASSRDGAVGKVVLENIIEGGFKGAIYPVNPKYDSVSGLACYHRVADLPGAPDLAVLVTPPATVPGIIAELGARGAKVAVVITAGITGALRQQMLDAAKPHLLRIIGPNTIGLVAPPAALNASFVHVAAEKGPLGLISQSGAIVSSVIDWAAAEGIGFSQVYSLGDMADVDVGDCLNVLAADAETQAILVYLESIPDTRKFMSAARAASRIKPVIAVKSGRHAEAAKAAATHTGALAGADRVVDAALRRAGIIRVDDLDDLFNAAEVTSRFAPLRQGRVAIVTNGGGAGVMAVDQLLDQGCTMAALSEATMAQLDAVLPATWSHANPVDIIGDAPPERYRAALQAVGADASVDAVLVMNCPTALADPVAAAQSLVNLAKDGTINGKPILTCWLGKQAAEPARNLLQRAGIASFDTPAQAAEAVALLTRWSELRARLERVPASAADFAVDRDAVQSIISAVALEGRTILTEWEAKAVLRAYGVPVLETLAVATESEVEEAAAAMLADTAAVVVKMNSKAVSHKSDIGGVVLNLRTAAEARDAATAIRGRFETRYPDTPLDGFTVQAMVSRPKAEELIVGIGADPSFGPVALFGAGGISVEVVDDTATGLVPLDAVLAGDLIDHTRISKKLAGYRDRKPADRTGIIQALLGLSQLAVDFRAISTIDINPLLADADGVLALDARIEIDVAHVGDTGTNPLLAIRPYPSGWDTQLTAGGSGFLLRPIRPEDAALYPDFLDRVTAEDLRLRFLMPTRVTEHSTMVRLTQLDYNRDIAFVAVEQGSGDLAGIVRYSADPDRDAAEFGILVRSDLQHLGLGRQLMAQLITYAKAEHIGRLDGLILSINHAMLALCRELGFSLESDASDSTLTHATLPLSDAPGRASAPRSGT